MLSKTATTATPVLNPSENARFSFFFSFLTHPKWTVKYVGDRIHDDKDSRQGEGDRHLKGISVIVILELFMQPLKEGRLGETSQEVRSFFFRIRIRRTDRGVISHMNAVG